MFQVCSIYTTVPASDDSCHHVTEKHLCLVIRQNGLQKKAEEKLSQPLVVRGMF
jgi:hypothetical protein